MRWFALAASVCMLASCARMPPRPHDKIRFAHGPHLAAGVRCLQCHNIWQPGSKDGLAPAFKPSGDAGVPSLATAESALPPTAAAADGGVVSAQAAQAAAAQPTPSTEAQEAAQGEEATRIFPKEQKCKQCHTQPAERECRFCHTHPEAAASYSERDRPVRFNHGNHFGRGVRGCVGCHGLGSDANDRSAAAFSPRLPPMQPCTKSCHAADMPALACSRCHIDLHRYKRSQVELVRHPPGFLHEHGTRARAQSSLCSQCHEPSFCSECHTASPGLPAVLLHPTEVSRDFIHGADFKARHPSEARLEQATCLRCHGVSFCDGCHRDTGIGGGVGAQSPHPPGWLDPLSPRGHARAARSNILTCAACHDSDASHTCVPCHRVGSIAGNPHPPGFGAGSDKTRQGVCRVCHGDAR